MSKKNNPTIKPSPSTPSTPNPSPNTKGIEVPRRPAQPKPQTNPVKK